MVQPFEPSRPDGRSDKRVIFELVRPAAPETVFGFDELGAALSAGLDGPVSRERIGRAVRAANRLLLTEERRYLVSVQNVGYRMARADEHGVLAVSQRERSYRTMRKGWQIVKFTRTDELPEASRALHQGTLLMMGGLVQAMAAFDRRQSRHEEVIEELRQRVSVLEERN